MVIFVPRFTDTLLTGTFCSTVASLTVSSSDEDRFTLDSTALVIVFLFSDTGEVGGVGSTVGNSR